MKIGILINESKEEARALQLELMAWLEARGIATACPRDVYCRENVDLDKALHQLDQADVILVLGGDGTLIHAALLLAGRNTPLLGVNLGRLGFLTSLERDTLYQGLEKFFRGEYRIDERMMFDVELFRNDCMIGSTRVLNDAVVSKDALARMVDIRIRINGEFVDRYSADGLIIATPTGSTAYSMSAGGPIVAPNLSAVILTPICAHTLSSRPMVVSGEEEVEVTLLKASTDVMLTCDGQTGMRMKVGDMVRIRRSTVRTRFVRFWDRSFYDILHEKLNPGVSNG